MAGIVVAGGGSRIGSVRPLTQREHNAVSAVVIATGLLGVLGFVNSFARVNEAAGASFGWFAWTVPLGIDIGIAIFAALDIVLARLDMRVRWLRLIPWSLTAATVYLNVADEPTWFGKVAHAVLPGLWVIAVEIAAHTLRVRTGLVTGTRMDRIRRARWLLALPSTAGLWRRMVLWEMRSYPDALRRERDRLLALTELQDAYGHLRWRWKAPKRARVLYRLGELAPADLMPALGIPAPAPTIEQEQPALPPVSVPAPAGTPQRAARRQAQGVGRVRRTGRRTRKELRTAATGFLAEHPDASARALAVGIGTRWETARDLLAEVRPTVPGEETA